MIKIENEEQWREFVEKTFQEANLPDVPRIKLKAGCYSNMEIAEAYRDSPQELIRILSKFSCEDLDNIRREAYSRNCRPSKIPSGTCTRARQQKVAIA